ncbi:MAG TPA: hypothetical protein VKP13_03480, partial [Nitrospira sp.]|nr:hypothetical protein [Nitrospira sp.]
RNLGHGSTPLPHGFIIGKTSCLPCRCSFCLIAGGWWGEYGGAVGSDGAGESDRRINTYVRIEMSFRHSEDRK